MIDTQLYLGFVLAACLLILIPGPNVALIVGNSVGHGTRYGLLTVAGTSAAVAVQLGLTVLGMAAVLGALADWFEWIRWAGVAYLVWLGIARWRARAVHLGPDRAEPRSAARTITRGFLVSLTNPKILLFYGAFLPQFIAPDRPPRRQLVLLAATFLTLALVLDSGWALLGGRARRLLASNGRLLNRLSGSLLIGAGLGLAIARRS